MPSKKDDGHRKEGAHPTRLLRCCIAGPDPDLLHDPAAYARYLLKKTGLATVRTLASLTPEELAKLLAAIQTYEGWKEGKIVTPTTPEKA